MLGVRCDTIKMGSETGETTGWNPNRKYAVFSFCQQLASTGVCGQSERMAKTMENHKDGKRMKVKNNDRN